MMKRALLTMLVFGLVAAGWGVAGAGATAPTTASVTIRHQVRGCHAWSVNGGPFAASHATTLARGGAITFTNNDVMPQR